jgi:hypothetical protein
MNPMKSTHILIVGLIILVLGVVYFVSTNRPDTTIAPSAEQIEIAATPATDTITDTLLAGGSSYLDPKGVYTFLYPNEYTLDIQDPVHIRVYKRGVTQRPQSEMSDGALVVFESLDVTGQTLEEWVDAQIKTSTADGTSEVVEAKKATTLNGYPGFTYQLRGLGTSQYLVAQKDTQSNAAVIVTYMVSDPEGVGYQRDVDAILSSIELLK